MNKKSSGNGNNGFDSDTIAASIKKLTEEMALIREENEEYALRRLRDWPEEQRHLDRMARLKEIVVELAKISVTTLT